MGILFLFLPIDGCRIAGTRKRAIVARYRLFPCPSGTYALCTFYTSCHHLSFVYDRPPLLPLEIEEGVM